MTKTAHSLGDEGLRDQLQILSFIIYMEVFTINVALLNSYYGNLGSLKNKFYKNQDLESFNPQITTTYSGAI